jgi:hypothetical protein
MLLTLQVLLSLSETRPMECWLVVVGGDLKISLALAGRVFMKGAIFSLNCTGASSIIVILI